MKINKALFFSEYKKSLDIDHKLVQSEVDAIDFFISKVELNWDTFSLKEWAYVFATTFHETAFTFLPVIEAFRFSDNWRKKNLRYYPYFGRGYVQLTWLKNYKVFSKLLGVDLAKNPNLACDRDIAFKVLIIGCKKGLFTGVGLGKYMKDGVADYLNMRRVINGTDRAETIADYAREFERILKLTTK